MEERIMINNKIVPFFFIFILLFSIFNTGFVNSNVTYDDFQIEDRDLDNNDINLDNNVIEDEVIDEMIKSEDEVIDDMINVEDEANNSYKENVSSVDEGDNSGVLDEIILEENSVNQSIDYINITQTNEESDFEYIDIEDILNSSENDSGQFIVSKSIKDNNEENTNNTNDTVLNIDSINEIVEKKLRLFYMEGEKIIEIETSKEIIPIIEKKEELTLDGKQVIISSEEHFDEEIRVFSKLEEETKRDDIKIYWENEDEFLSEGIEFYDENENGLVDKVSWIVPHLSTQIFKIILNSDSYNSVSEEIIISEIIVPENTVSNPVNFAFNISYLNISDINCSLRLNNNYLGSGFNFSLLNDLQNGDYNWNYTCQNTNNITIYSQKSGSFKVDEGFWISGLKNMYLLNKKTRVLENENQITFNSKKNSIVKFYIDRPGTLSDTTNQSGNTNYNFNLDESIISESGIYKIMSYYDGLESLYPLGQEFYVSQYEISAPNSSLINKEVTFFLDIDSIKSGKKVSNIIVSYGDGSANNLDGWSFNDLRYTKNMGHTYNKTGNYDFEVEFMINGEQFSVTHKIKIESDEDNIDPEVNLLSPEDEAMINIDNATFKFEVEEKNEIKECNFSIYNVTYSQSLWSYDEDDLVYNYKLTNSQLNSLEEGKSVEIEIVDFEERTYAWEVGCLDNSSNYGWSANFFEVSFNGQSNLNTLLSNNSANYYSKENIVKNLIDKSTEFIEKEEIWSNDEKQALEELGLINEVKYMKKRLIQIDQDLKYNIDYISSESLKQQRIQELNDEIDKIEDTLPVGIEILDSYEYIKNGNSVNWEDLIDLYIEKSGTKTKSKKDFIKTNEQLQNQLAIETDVKEINLKYIDRTENFVLVIKKIGERPDESEKILEVIPEGLSEDISLITFITKVKILEEKNLFEINLGDLSESKIKYKLEGELDINDLEETDTLALTEKLKESTFSSKLTGFFVFDDFSYDFDGSMIMWLLVIILVIFVMYMLYRIFSNGKIKKDPRAFKILFLLDGIKQDLRINDMDGAKLKYAQIKEEYSLLDNDQKENLISKIQKVVGEMDKCTIFNLTREFKKAKNNFRNEEAMELQKEIRQICHRLPNASDRDRVMKVINGF
jgi:hypothetical protein